MADAELRSLARAAEENPDDESAAHAWASAARRSGDAAARLRGVAHFARFGDAASYDELARSLPWPRPGGYGETRRVRHPDDLKDTTARLRAGEERLEKAGVADWLHFSIEFDRALVASNEGGAFSVDLETGRVIWDTRTRGPSVRDYSPQASFIEGDRIRHPKFGEGTVARLAGRTKIVVYFQDDERTLVHNKGAARPETVELPQKFHRVVLAGPAALLEDEDGATGLCARTGAPRFAIRLASIAAADPKGVVLLVRRDPHGRTTKGGLLEVDAKTGAERYYFPGSSVQFHALADRVLLASRVRRKGFIDRESERELVALDRDDKARLLWRREDSVATHVSDRAAYVDGRDGKEAVDLLSGAPLPDSETAR